MFPVFSMAYCIWYKNTETPAFYGLFMPMCIKVELITGALHPTYFLNRPCIGTFVWYILIPTAYAPPYPHHYRHLIAGYFVPIILHRNETTQKILQKAQALLLPSGVLVVLRALPA